MVNCWNSYWSNERLKFKSHPKFPFQRVEQRHNQMDMKSLFERQQMEKQSRRVSIGVLTVFPPKPDTLISNFTLALPKAIPKKQLYGLLMVAFQIEMTVPNDDCLTKSVYVYLPEPMRFVEIRERIKSSPELNLLLA